MNKIFQGISFYIICCLVFNNTFAQSPDWTWLSKSTWIGGIGSTIGITHDSNGNAYMTGQFASPTLTLGNQTVTNYSYNDNLTICTVKYDSTGNVKWTRTATGYFDYIKPNSITVDNSGNVFVTGCFHGDSIIFGNYILRSPYQMYLYDNFFVVKYSSSGQVMWAKCMSSANNINGSCNGNGIDTDESGNAYIIGNFSSNNIIIDSDTLVKTDSSTYPYNNIFLLKLNNQGNSVWIKQFSGNMDDSGNNIAVKDDKILITGEFQSPTLSFQGIDLHCLSSANVSFITKLDTSGNVIWANGQKASGNSFGKDVDFGINGVCYLAGNFDGNSLVIGSDTLSSNGLFINNFFCAAYDSTGNPLWAKCPADCLESWVSSISTDESGEVYLIGHYYCDGSQGISFDGTHIIKAFGAGNNVYIVKYNQTGSVEWAKAVGGTGSDFGTGISAEIGKIYVCGLYWSPQVIFGNIVATADTGYYCFDEFFVGKLSGTCDPVTIVQQPQDQSGVLHGSATFSVSAAGSPIFFYQWYQDGYPISGANDSIHTLTNITSQLDNSTYYCEVSNCSFCNSSISSIAVLSIVDCTQASFFLQPQSQTCDIGATATFSVGYTGSPPSFIQWFKNNIAIPGATSSNYTTPILSAADHNSMYFCIVTNCDGLGVASSQIAVLTLNGVGIQNEQLFENVILYPNPASDVVYAEMPEGFEGTIVSLYNAEGALVRSYGACNEKLAEFDINDLTEGVYFMKFENQRTSFYKKVVKN